MNRANMQLVVNAIAANPQQFDMGHFFRRAGWNAWTSTDTGITMCLAGFAATVAGWIPAWDGPNHLITSWVKRPGEQDRCNYRKANRVAQEFLELSADQIAPLFYGTFDDLEDLLKGIRDYTFTRMEVTA